MSPEEFKKQFRHLLDDFPYWFFLNYGKCVHCDSSIEVIMPDNGRFKFFIYKNDQLVLMTIDHIVPTSVGGTDAIVNLQPLCELCNSTKGNQSESLFYKNFDSNIPADFFYQIRRHREDKKMKDFYPDWKPYYGL